VLIHLVTVIGYLLSQLLPVLPGKAEGRRLTVAQLRERHHRRYPYFDPKRW
jgi:hypothetical protein